MFIEREQPYRRYRKITPTVARVLTEQDYQTYQGVIQTHEGPKAFLPGDYLATDSVSPSVRPALGEWGYAEWRNPSYQRPPVEVLGLERARHVEMTRTWLHGFRQTCHYRPIPPRQLSLF